MMNRFLLLLALLSAPAPALAQGQVDLTSHVALERTVTDSSGKATVKLEEPAKVVPGDKLLFTIHYANASGKPADHFVVTNPIPSAVAFAGGETEGAQVSVDGGKTFGALGALKVRSADGSARPALPADVTHIRWTFAKPVAAGASDTLRFHATVR